LPLEQEKSEMANKLKRLLLFFTLISMYLGLTFAAPVLPNRELKDQIAIKNKAISHLKKQISQAEYLMRKKSDDHDKITKEKKELELALITLKGQLLPLEAELKSLQAQLHLLLAKYLLEALPGKEYAIEELASRKLLKEESLRQFSEVKSLNERLKTLNEAIAEKEKILGDYEQREEELSLVIGKLEVEKEDQTKSYLDETDTLMKLQKDFVKNQNELKAQNKVLSAKISKNDGSISDGPFLSPLKNFQQMEANKKKGVSFYFKGIENIFAPADGVIDHQGQLSTFGHVIIINHGREERSIILGDISSKLRVGDKVKRGQFLGHAGTSTSEVSKVYYDIRIKNQVKDTYSLLDKSSLSQEKTLYQEQTVKI
jgi:septal ring factor EnvC (AmiA/AmiB activator)